VELDRALGDDQGLADLPVALALGQFLQHLDLAVGEGGIAGGNGEAGGLKTTVDTCIFDGKTTVVYTDTTDATKCFVSAGESNIQATSANGAIPVVTIGATGTATIVATFGQSAAADLKAGTPKTLTWTRTTTGTWTCATNAAAKYAPSGCPGV